MYFLTFFLKSTWSGGFIFSSNGTARFSSPQGRRYLGTRGSAPYHFGGREGARSMATSGGQGGRFGPAPCRRAEWQKQRHGYLPRLRTLGFT